jgi:hypothetical protein
MRPPSLWKQDKQQQQPSAYDVAMQTVAPAAPSSASIPTIGPVGPPDGRQTFVTSWGGAPVAPQVPSFSGMPYTFMGSLRGPLPGPSAAELLQSAVPDDEDITRVAPCLGGHLAGYSGASGRSTSSPSTIGAPSSLPPLPPLASGPPPPPAPLVVPRQPSPLPADSQHRSIVMQVSASLARTRPPDDVNTPQLLMTCETSSMAAADELGEEFAQAAAAIGTDSDDDVVRHLGGDDRAMSPPAMNELERAATAPPASEHGLITGGEEVSRCVSVELGGGQVTAENQPLNSFSETRSRRSLAACKV